MTDMTSASPATAAKPKPRPRPQVMKLTDAAAQRITELTNACRFRDRRPARRDQERRLRRPVLHGRIRPRDPPDRRSRRGQGRQDPGRSQGRAVPARHRDGLQGRQDAGAVHLQQPEPGLGLRLRRVGATEAGEGLIPPGQGRDDGWRDGPRIPDRPVCRFRSGHHPPDVLRLRHFRRRHQFRAGAARRALFPRRRRDHSAIRGRGLKAFSVSDPRQDRHGELLLAIAGAPVRRFRRAGAWARAAHGRRAARRVTQAAAGAKKQAAKTGRGQKAGGQKAESREAKAAGVRPPGCAVSAAYSGSTSQITRLRPLRLAA